MNRTAAAFHEAGHAVAADAMQRRVVLLSIEAIGRLGGVCYSVAADAPQIAEAEVASEIRARAHAPLRPLPPLRFDPIETEPVLLLLLAGPVAQRRYSGAIAFDWQTGGADLLAAISLVGGPDGWRHFFAALGRTEELVRDRWEEVTALAAALWLHGRLDGAAVAATLERVQSRPRWTREEHDGSDGVPPVPGLQESRLNPRQRSTAYLRGHG
ncbi:hypothetical protein BH23GEM7_BH23GEM7_27140 [soil metagenome]